jgi:hypothetical protein
MSLGRDTREYENACGLFIWNQQFAGIYKRGVLDWLIPAMTRIAGAPG